MEAAGPHKVRSESRQGCRAIAQAATHSTGGGRRAPQEPAPVRRELEASRRAAKRVRRRVRRCVQSVRDCERERGKTPHDGAAA
eukprot:2373575-Heterocapsa_arctica.AAC.1